MCEVHSVKSTVYYYFSLDHRPVTWYNHVYMVEHTRMTLISNLLFYSENKIRIPMDPLTRVWS